MERIGFLVEATGEVIRCLLNPEGVLIQRQAGIHERPVGQQSWGGPRPVEGLVAGGPGLTLITLDLLFEAETAGTDVRRFTTPLWNLVEGQATGTPALRLVWGKSWNWRGVIVNAAERLERFDAAGLPARAWVRIQFRRLAEEPGSSTSRPLAAASAPQVRAAIRPTGPRAGGERVVLARGRLDQLAALHLQDPRRWRELARLNHIADPLAELGLRPLRLPEDP